VFLDFVIVLIKAGVVLFALLNLAALLTWAERKQSAAMQDRIGPNRANLGNVTALGLFHVMADGIKMIAKSGWFAARPSGTEDVYRAPIGRCIRWPRRQHCFRPWWCSR